MTAPFHLYYLTAQSQIEVNIVNCEPVY